MAYQRMAINMAYGETLAAAVSISSYLLPQRVVAYLR